MDYYKEKYKIDFEYHIFQPKKDTPAGLYTMIKKNKYDYIISGFLPAEFNAFFQTQFPKLIHHSEGYTYDINCYSKESANKTLAETFLFNKTNTYDPGSVSPPWNTDISMIRKDSISGNSVIALDSVHEWGPGFSVSLNEIISVRNSELLASVKIRSAQPSKEAVLVLQISIGDSLIHWQGSELGNYSIAGSEWQTIFTSCKLIDLLKSGKELNDYKLSIYFWNKGKAQVFIDELTVSVKKGNPLVYGLFWPIG